MEGKNVQNEKIIWACWEDKSPREVVREAAAKGSHINLAIKFLMARNSWNESTATDWFMAEVCNHWSNIYHCLSSFATAMQTDLITYTYLLQGKSMDSSITAQETDIQSTTCFKQSKDQ